MTGLEVAVQNQLPFLPSPFNGIGLTRTTRSPIRRRSFRTIRATSTLPGQSRHVGNLAGSYEKGGFSGRDR